jgi:peroxiredoxin
MPPTIGAPAPEFTLKDQDQKEVKLSDFRGKKRVVLVFYPLDWSPVCTKEHACMVNDKKQFDQLDAQVLGLSVDSVWSHKAYADKMGIHYPLLADFHPAAPSPPSTASISKTKASPAAPSPSSTATATWPGTKTTTSRSCPISTKSRKR